jgi:hypothetical protein
MKPRDQLRTVIIDKQTCTNELQTRVHTILTVENIESTTPYNPDQHLKDITNNIVMLSLHAYYEMLTEADLIILPKEHIPPYIDDIPNETQ